MPIALRTDFDATAVRSAARLSKDGAQTRRLLALAAIYEGSSRTEAARIGGVTLQIVRDWVMKFNVAGPGGLIDATLGTARSAHHLGLHLRRNLPAGGKSGRPRPAVLQHRHDEPAPGGDRSACRARRPRRGAHGSGRLAPDAEARAARQYLDRRNPLEMPPNSTHRKTSGSSCATTGSRTACSAPTTRSSTIAATPGTVWSSNHPASRRSACENGPKGSDQ